MLNHKRWFAGTSGVLAIASTLLLIACSGDGSDKLPTTGATLGTDTYAPTVVISGQTPEAKTGTFTLTFTFNEQIQTTGAAAFTADDIVISAGTKGTLAVTAQNANSQTVATLPITPPASSQGTITVSIPTGAFTDMAGNVNEVPTLSVQQTYDTAVDYPAVTTLYTTTGTTNLATTREDWGSGQTTNEAYALDTTYNPCIQVVGQTGSWGNCIVFKWNSMTMPAATAYSTLNFKVKSSTMTSILIKFPEYQVRYQLSSGTALANGWVQMAVPMSDFTSHTGAGGSDFHATDGRVAFIDQNADGSDTANTFYLTDINFSGLLD